MTAALLAILAALSLSLPPGAVPAPAIVTGIRPGGRR